MTEMNAPPPLPRRKAAIIAIRTLAVIGGLAVVTLVLWLVTLTPIWRALSITGDIVYEELPRVVSPNGKFEIVAIRSNGGATTSFGYEIFVVPKGEVVRREKDEIYLVFRSIARTRLLGYKWRDQTVELRVRDGAIGFRHSYYGYRHEFDLNRVGPVVLTVVED